MFFSPLPHSIESWEPSFFYPCAYPTTHQALLEGIFLITNKNQSLISVRPPYLEPIRY